MSAVLLKHEELYERLWEELIKLSPGDKFMSIREIMKGYGVSQLTADKTLMRFREEGYLKVCPGRGLFTSDLISRFRTVSEQPCYLLAVPRWISADIDILEETVARLKQKYPQRRLLVHKFDISGNIPSQLPFAAENIAGVVVLPSAGDMGFDDVQRLKSFPCPVVILGHKLGGMGFACVGTDDVFAGNLAAHHLFEQGHRHIGVLLSEPHNRIIMNRVDAIVNYMELRGGTVEIIDCGVKSGEYATDKAYHKFFSVIREKFSFTALIGISGESAQGAVNACLNNGISIPEELSIAVIGAEQLSATFHPPLNTVAVDFAVKVEMALDLLDRLDSGETLSEIEFNLRPYLIDRGSVRNISGKYAVGSEAFRKIEIVVAIHY